MLSRRRRRRRWRWWWRHPQITPRRRSRLKKYPKKLPMSNINACVYFRTVIKCLYKLNVYAAKLQLPWFLPPINSLAAGVHRLLQERYRPLQVVPGSDPINAALRCLIMRQMIRFADDKTRTPNNHTMVSGRPDGYELKIAIAGKETERSGLLQVQSSTLPFTWMLCSLSLQS